MNLYEVVNEFAERIYQQKLTGDKPIQINNEIKPALGITSGQHILHQLLTDLVGMAEPGVDNYIHVSAKLFNQLVLVQLKTNIQFDSLATEQSLRSLNEMAEKLGGCLYISNDRRDEQTISCTYLSQAKNSASSKFNNKYKVNY